MDELNMDCSDVELFYNKLRPCPFCGGEAELRNDKELNGVTDLVECIECGCQTRVYYTHIKTEIDQFEVVIKVWNTRLNSEFKQEVEEALMFVDHIKEHLYEPFLDVKCKICDKTMNEITGGTYGHK